MFLVGFLFQVELPKCSLFFPSMHLNGVWFPIYFKSTRSSCCFTPRQRFVPISGAVDAKKKTKTDRLFNPPIANRKSRWSWCFLDETIYAISARSFFPPLASACGFLFLWPLSTDPVLRRVEMLIITKQLIWMQFHLLAIVFPFLVSRNYKCLIALFLLCGDSFLLGQMNYRLNWSCFSPNL